eukprot:9152304-Pyramimonas_sp.AAC.2
MMYLAVCALTPLPRWLSRLHSTNLHSGGGSPCGPRSAHWACSLRGQHTMLRHFRPVLGPVPYFFPLLSPSLGPANMS